MRSIAHTSQEDLLKKVVDAHRSIDVNATYFHYKDTDRARPYKIIVIVINESTEEVCVVYQAQYGENLTWMRTVVEFTSEITTDHGIVSRFSV